MKTYLAQLFSKISFDRVWERKKIKEIRFCKNETKLNEESHTATIVFNDVYHFDCFRENSGWTGIVKAENIWSFSDREIGQTVKEFQLNNLI